MRRCPGILKPKKRGWRGCLFTVYLFFPLFIFGQETSSRATGKVISENGEIPAGVTVALIHESTQNKYHSIASYDGYFHFFNLKPGGPYTIIISSVTHDTLKKTNLFIHLNSD